MLSRSANLLAPHARLEDKERSELTFAPKPKGHENLAQGFTASPPRRALKWLQIECVNSTRLTNGDLSPLQLQAESPYLLVSRIETLG